MKREKVLETVKELPVEFELDELIDRLVFVEKVDEGLKQLNEGKTISHDKFNMVKWWTTV